ncbi:hypothetical protein [Nitrosomonas supralitoralis]|uniref:Uncharacterized protein n=1 Tax=Nitrosomonas supralitoralis TaxID=2116706 RepID=A0A2P7NX99_9PROT|nr:hypothetical protein [Nitrosomonas supralitoralis]PSJ18055.1 hypothetical protein C7H79_05060 [Nitrosomonas supralitoralis]
MFYKEIVSAIAIALTLMAFIPYIRAILKGSVKPHVFSWIIWGATTLLIFVAQLEDKGGVGTWPIGVSASITIFIAYLAFLKRADISITRTDWVFFISALSSLPLWYFTSDPLWAVVLLTTIDVIGFGPTVRKIYHFPYSESLLFFALFTVRNVLVILALENLSVTTLLFPVVMVGLCILLIALISYRRRFFAMQKVPH